MRKILVCGGRNFDDWGLMLRTLIDLCNQNPRIDCLVHGNARGADRMARDIFDRWGQQTKAYPANWNVFGKKAGFIRNQQMLDEEPDIDLVVAFPGGNGTADMVRRARAAGIPVKEIQ